jgi:hypothetical protein
MKTVVTEKTPKLLPWGVEIELVNDRCIYMSAQKVSTHADHVDIVVNESNVISIPKESIRKLLIMGSNEGQKDST